MRQVDSSPDDLPQPGGFGKPIRPPAPPTEAEQKAKERERLNSEFKQAKPTPERNPR